jgi:hypothetical protein
MLLAVESLVTMPLNNTGNLASSHPDEPSDMAENLIGDIPLTPGTSDVRRLGR